MAAPGGGCVPVGLCCRGFPRLVGAVSAERFGHGEVVLGLSMSAIIATVRVVSIVSAVAAVVALAACGGSSSAGQWKGVREVIVNVSQPSLGLGGSPHVTRFRLASDLTRVTAALNAHHIAVLSPKASTPICHGMQIQVGLSILQGDRVRALRRAVRQAADWQHRRRSDRVPVGSRSGAEKLTCPAGGRVLVDAHRSSPALRERASTRSR